MCVFCYCSCLSRPAVPNLGSGTHRMDVLREVICNLFTTLCVGIKVPSFGASVRHVEIWAGEGAVSVSASGVL